MSCNQSRVVLMVTMAFAVAIIASCVFADVSHLPGQGQEVQPVTEVCLGCICEAISGCNRTRGCVRDICGLFSITWPYWADSGKPTQPGDDPSSPEAYANCANEPYCAARAVQGYMGKFGQDCNGDGVINCLDHAAIHVHGGYGCHQELPAHYKSRFDQCLNQVGAVTGRSGV